MTRPLFPGPTGTMGEALPRYERHAKVTGWAHYASDVRLARTAHAYLLTSRIGRGSVQSFDLAAARAVSGVLDILIHATVGDEIRQVPAIYAGGYLSNSVRPLGSAEIAYWASRSRWSSPKTFEAAREAAHRIGVTYAPHQAPAARMDAPGAAAQPLEPMTIAAGDFDTAFTAAPVKIDAVYTTTRSAP